MQQEKDTDFCRDFLKAKTQRKFTFPEIWAIWNFFRLSGFLTSVADWGRLSWILILPSRIQGQKDSRSRIRIRLK